jgi:hypothetical protein
MGEFDSKFLVDGSFVEGSASARAIVVTWRVST